MQHYQSLEAVHYNNVWLTIGSFDGVHRGHQEILNQLTTAAHKNNAIAVALTFHPHPLVVLRNYQAPLYLTTPERRAELLGQYGVDVVVTVQFTLELAELTAFQFLQKLQHHLRIEQLWVGYDFALGKNREGNISVLRQLGQTFGYTLQEMAAIKIDGDVVSSRQIRALLAAGKVELATEKLGRPYQVQGKVVAGDGRGRTIGIPTANMLTYPQIFLPGRGVYACWAEVEGQRLAAATNIGIRPTFDNSSSTSTDILETHLLDYQGDLYGKDISLEFITHLRSEQIYCNPNLLVTQIHKDIASVRQAVGTGESNTISQKQPG